MTTSHHHEGPAARLDPAGTTSRHLGEVPRSGVAGSLRPVPVPGLTGQVSEEAGSGGSASPGRADGLAGSPLRRLRASQLIRRTSVKVEGQSPVEINTLGDLKTKLPKVHTACQDYLRARFKDSGTADSWLEDWFLDYVAETTAIESPALLQAQLLEIFETKLADVDPSQKIDPTAPPVAATPVPKDRYPLGTAEPNPVQPVASGVDYRKTGWGGVAVLAPVSGSRTPPATRPTSASFTPTLEEIRATQIGRSLLAEFDPAGPGKYRSLTTDQKDPYFGVTVLIGLPSKIKPRLETRDMGPLISGDQRANNGPTIPRIHFFKPPAPQEKPLAIAEGSATVTAKGVEGHLDFPGEVQPFDAVLFHEFGHAFLSQIGVSKEINDSQEEQIVVGIMSARGLVSGENAYRCERGYKLRNSYLDANIPHDTAMASSFWTDEKQRIGMVKALVQVTGKPEAEVRAWVFPK